MILEVRPIPILILQIDTTRVMTDLTPNQVAQMDPEDLAALIDQEVQVVQVVLEDLEDPMAQEDWADLATIFPMSKISYKNS